MLAQDLYGLELNFSQNTLRSSKGNCLPYNYATIVLLSIRCLVEWILSDLAYRGLVSTYYKSAHHMSCHNGASPTEMHPDPSNDLLHRLIRSAGEVKAILDRTRETWLNAAELERCFLCFFHLGEVHLEEVLDNK